jgi:hypothetical protein
MPQKRPTLGQRHYSYWREVLDEDSSYVYVIRGPDGPVKIGVAKRPITRLKTLQTGNPHRLRLLLVVPGSEKLESLLHHRFAANRVADSEWFYGEGVAAIVQFVTALAMYSVRNHDGGMDPTPLAGFPDWSELERHRLRKATVAMTPSSVEPSLTVIEGDRDRNYVPTIARRIRGASIRPRPVNRAGATQ